MTLKEFHESVAFRLALNKWAASRPGYVSAVTKMDIKNVMARIRPQLMKPKRSAALATLKYSILVQVQKESKIEPFVMPEDQVKRVWRELLKEKLVVRSEKTEKFQITSRGRKYLEAFKPEGKT